MPRRMHDEARLRAHTPHKPPDHMILWWSVCEVPACGQAVVLMWCLCDTPELCWRGAAGQCARVRACAEVPPNIYIHIYTYIDPPPPTDQQPLTTRNVEAF